MSGRRLTAGGVCTRAVTIAYRGMRLAEAARAMREQDVGCLVVVEQMDPGRAVVDILTDRDIVVSVIAKDQDARFMSVGEAMTTDVVIVREDDSVLDVLDLMRRKGIRRIPVTGPQGVLVGIVTLDDLLGIVSEEMQALAGAIVSARRHERTQRLQ